MSDVAIVILWSVSVLIWLGVAFALILVGLGIYDSLS